MSEPAPGARVPAELARWIGRFGTTALDEEDAEVLTSGAVRALREALARPGRDREGAFALLAADALLTEASRRALEAPDPAEALAAMVGRVSEEVDG